MHLNSYSIPKWNERPVHKRFSRLCQSLLDEPNPNSPANSQAAQLYQENKREYEKRVSAIVEQSCRDCWPASGPARRPPSVCCHLSPLPPPLVFGMLPSLNQQKQFSDFSLHALYIHPPLHRRFYFARQKGFTIFLYLCTLNIALTLFWDGCVGPFAFWVAGFTGMMKADVFWRGLDLCESWFILSLPYFSQRERKHRRALWTMPRAFDLSWAVLHAWQEGVCPRSSSVLMYIRFLQVNLCTDFALVVPHVIFSALVNK